MSELSRREFLRLLGLLPLVSLSGKVALPPLPTGSNDSERPNFIILLFDSLAAPNVSLYGYPRRTMPHLERLAEGATVFHRHYANGNYTNPGTASLLTGTLPWTHRSLLIFSPVIETREEQNIFRALAPEDYYAFGYSHNLIAEALMYQFRQDIDQLKKTQELCLLDFHLSDQLFYKDYDLAAWRERSWRAGEKPHTYPSSAIFFTLNHQLWLRRKEKLEAEYRDRFPRGLPRQHDQIFLMEDAVDWLIANTPRFPRPYLTYFHFTPPHIPYCTRREFYGLFDDGWAPPRKPEHHFTEDFSQEELDRLRMEYDEYIAYVDAELWRLYEHLERAGQLDNTYLILTSDHGEMFERGIWMHITPVLYEPLIHIPLIIKRPGQTQREDVHTPTSAIDVLPTLLHLAEQPIPDWCEGDVLPTLGGDIPADRPVFAIDSKSSYKQGPLTAATIAMLQGRYKLIYYFGYQDFDEIYELYDLENDPEELHDLYDTETAVAQAMRQTLHAALRDANQRNAV
ncbi:MAG: sulfatase [Anaerolineales bacterium]